MKGTKEKTCEFCEGTDFVQNVEYSPTKHEFVYVGLIVCNHPIEQQI